MIDRIDARTRVCAVIGNPIYHSLSPAIHNAGYRALDLPFVYVAFQVEDVAAAVAGMRGLSLAGLSVTIPHKTSVIPHLDGLDAVAEKLGSVNTVYWKDGKLWGTSSDGYGALRALESGAIDVTGRKIVFLGAGGVARAIGFTLALERPLREMVFLEAVQPELARALCAELGARTPARARSRPLDPGSLELELRDADVLVQCTPVGMTPKVGETLVPRNLLHPGLAVFDTVYTPALTRLMQEAEVAGCPLAYGREMFLYQAAIQFELFTGRSAPLEAMREALDAALAG
ncbi:shikimate dehydrogenase [bacterium]|nr:shikimate dehydrogenase [bacterium]